MQIVCFHYFVQSRVKLATKNFLTTVYTEIIMITRLSRGISILNQDQCFVKEDFDIIILVQPLIFST